MANKETCPYTTPSATVRRGSKGEAVKWVQWHLAMLYDGNPTEKRVDGKYGPATEKVVRAYQKHFGLKVDGIAGKATCTDLYERYEASDSDLQEVTYEEDNFLSDEEIDYDLAHADNENLETLEEAEIDQDFIDAWAEATK